LPYEKGEMGREKALTLLRRISKLENDCDENKTFRGKQRKLCVLEIAFIDAMATIQR